jgi:RNA polymerase subunit RPABC4/transcription elongation factor Spt4
MKCSSCGYSLPDDSKFCQYCGKKLLTASAHEAEATAELNAVIGESQPSLNEPKMPKECIPSSFDFPVYNVENPTFTYTPPEAEHTDESTSVDQPKRKHCSRCGGLIDVETKKCSACGKQYFRLSKKGVLTAAVLFIIIASAGLNIYQRINYIKLRESKIAASLNFEYQIKKRDLTISDMNSQITSLENENNDLYDTLWLYFEEVYFYKKYAAIVYDDGTNKYHAYGCDCAPHISGFWIYNTDLAELQGYNACPYCH